MFGGVTVRACGRACVGGCVGGCVDVLMRRVSGWEPVVEEALQGSVAPAMAQQDI